MAQADGVVANGTGSAVRSDINNQYAALWSNHSGSTEPSSGKVAYQFWADTNTNILKIRNSANNAWISLFTLAGGIDVDAASNFNEDVTFTGASNNVTWNKSADNLIFNDNAKACFGTGSDLKIYFNGTNGFLEDEGSGDLYVKATGDDLYLRGADDVFIQPQDGEDGIKAIGNSSVEAYFDNSKKLETNAGGVKIYDYLRFTDSGKVMLGESDDFSLFHNGSNSYIDNSTGLLYLRAADTYISNADGTETIARFSSNGAVEAYYDSSKKLETNAGGVKIYDFLRFTDSGKIMLGTSDDFSIWHNGTSSYLTNTTGELALTNSNGVLWLQGNNVKMRSGDGGEYLAEFNDDDNCLLYFDGTYKLKTYATGTMFAGDIRPSANDTYDCGVSAAKWDDVYATNGTIQTSDKNEKNTIVTSDLGLSFINKLKPVSYKFNNKTRTHYGLIAQDIETVLSEISKPTSGFAGFIKEDDSYGLRYNEFISPLIKAVQELSTKVTALESA